MTKDELIQELRNIRLNTQQGATAKVPRELIKMAEYMLAYSGASHVRFLANNQSAATGAQGLTSERIEEIAKAYFHQDDTELGDMKTAIRIAVREALAQAAPSASEQQTEPSKAEWYKGWNAAMRANEAVKTGDDPLAAISASPAALTDARIEQIASLNGLNMRAYLGLDRDVFFRVIRAILAASQADKGHQ